MNKEVLKNISILYVEDENDVRDFTSKILNPLLKKVFIAQDGEEGLKVFQENKDEIDLIVSDINMPKMDGLSMCDAIKKINSEIPELNIKIQKEFLFMKHV